MMITYTCFTNVFFSFLLKFFSKPTVLREHYTGREGKVEVKAEEKQTGEKGRKEVNRKFLE